MDKLIWYIKQLLPVIVWRWLYPDTFGIVDGTAQRIVNQLLEHFEIDGDVDLVNYIKKRVNS